MFWTLYTFYKHILIFQSTCEKVSYMIRRRQGVKENLELPLISSLIR